MPNGHTDVAADERVLLPRADEPLEQYAERLRRLHGHLTLLLRAVDHALASVGAAGPAGHEAGTGAEDGGLDAAGPAGRQAGAGAEDDDLRAAAPGPAGGAAGPAPPAAVAAGPAPPLPSGRPPRVVVVGEEDDGRGGPAPVAGQPGG